MRALSVVTFGVALLSSVAAAQSPTPEPTATPVASPAASPEAHASPTPVTHDSHFGTFQGGKPPDLSPSIGKEALGVPAARHASGTAWQPDTTPMHGWHHSLAGWKVMVHGNVFAGYLNQNDPGSRSLHVDDPGSPLDRGADAFVSMNHVMAMAQRGLGGGSSFTVRTMLSAEPFTMEAAGYPLTAQSGETFDGEPIHDRQHPHDLFMELAAMFDVPLGAGAGLQLYAAPSGEPALGPVAFPHRVSAQSNPLAPLGHHWEDSTHVSFGVATLGLYNRVVKVEGSAFNGREPDEKRLDIEYPGIDSWSTRVSMMPIPELVLQASYGYLRSPEELHPETSIRRWSTSLLYSRPLRARGNASMAVIWGQNDAGDEGTTNAITVESELNADGHNTIFFRGENIRKLGHDIGLESDLGLDVFDVTSFSLGYLYECGPYFGMLPSLGVMGTAAFLDASLEPLYDTASPRGFMVFLRMRPAAQGSHSMHHH